MKQMSVYSIYYNTLRACRHCRAGLFTLGHKGALGANNLVLGILRRACSNRRAGRCTRVHPGPLRNSNHAPHGLKDICSIRERFLSKDSTRLQLCRLHFVRGHSAYERHAVYTGSGHLLPYDKNVSVCCGTCHGHCVSFVCGQSDLKYCVDISTATNSGLRPRR